MSLSADGRIAAAGASPGEIAALDADYDRRTPRQQRLLDDLLASVDAVGLGVILAAWRAHGGAFGAGFSPGGPSGGGAPGSPFFVQVGLAAGSPQSGVPNMFLTSQDNATVCVLQLGADTLSAQIKGQHITSQRPLDTGVAAEITINPGHSTGVDQTGAGLRIGDGVSTGAGAGGGIGFILSPGGQSSGAGQNIQTGRFAMGDVGGLSAFYPQIVNNAFLGLQAIPWFAAFITTLNLGGGAGFWGKTPPATQPARPTDTASLIALVAAYGLSA